MISCEYRGFRARPWPNDDTDNPQLHQRQRNPTKGNTMSQPSQVAKTPSVDSLNMERQERKYGEQDQPCSEPVDGETRGGMSKREDV